jgi:hypothetical protein
MNPPQRGRVPVDFDDLFPGRYMKAGQLGDRKHTLTIVDVQTEMLPDDQGGERLRGVITFKEVPYAWVINKTNATLLRAMFGRDVTTWKGRKVTLYRGEFRKDYAIRVWGSPELREDRTIEFRLPKKSKERWTLHAVSDTSKRERMEKHPTEGDPHADAADTDGGGPSPEGGRPG